MISLVRTICAFSIFGAVLQSICPEGSIKQILSVVFSVAMAAIIIEAAKGLDYSAYALEIAKYRDREAELSSYTEPLQKRLNRIIIEEEYRSYIEDKAAQLGCEIGDTQIEVRWSTEGVWVPYSSNICLESDNGKDALTALLAADLGIPPERQTWILNE